MKKLEKQENQKNKFCNCRTCKYFFSEEDKTKGMCFNPLSNNFNYSLTSDRTCNNNVSIFKNYKEVQNEKD